METDTSPNTGVTRGAAANKQRVVDYIVRYLTHVARARHVFGVHGANIEDLFDAVLRADGGLCGVIAKHEFSAGAMADGYYRVGNRLGVVAATSGGGALNLVPALGEAYASEVPVLALVGQPPTSLEGHGAFQDQSGVNGALNGRGVFGSVSRFCERVEKPDDIGDLLPAAVAAATREPGGPAVLLLPKDVQQAAVELDVPTAPSTRASTARAVLDGRVSALLKQAVNRRGEVVLIAGPGVARSDARAETAALAAALDACVVVEADGKDAFDNHSPRFAGVAGAMGHPTVREHLDHADLCVLVGTRLPHGSRYDLDDALSRVPLVCFAHEPPFLDAYRDDEILVVPGDLRSALRAAVNGLPTVEPTREGTAPRYLPSEPVEDGLSSRDVIDLVGAVIGDTANVVSDAGNACSAAIHFLRAPRRGRQVLALGMGGMGFSFGAGVGAAFANGERTYVLAGDGSFFMHGMEIHTAVEHNLPITFVVFNNNAHAMCVTREGVFYPGTQSYNRFRHSDIGAGVAAMFPGLRATTTRDLTELRAFLLGADAAGGPAFVSVDVATDEIPPYAPLRNAMKS